ncbi:MAG: hypothetical protein JOY93_02450 [Acidobacteriales bacterium]|nr:hypothetical protein [Terriglobales bacterium]
MFPSNRTVWPVVMFLSLAAFLMILVLATVPAKAATPASGTVSDTSPTLTYTAGPYYAPNATDQAGNPVCTVPNSCDIFTLTVNAAAADQKSKQVTISIAWPNVVADFDLYVFNSSGTLLGVANNGSDPHTVTIPAVSGTYTVEADPFLPLGQSFVGTISLQPKPVGGKQGAGVPPRYLVYPAPNSAGGAAMSGEPSIGVDWNPNVASLKHDLVNQGGVAFFTSNLNEYRVSFNDCSSPASTLWEDVTSPVETVNTLDPIGFCDHFGASPGRVFQSQLAGATSLMAYSDDDGNTWTQSQGSGQPAGVDHQTVGAGPYNPSSTPPPPPHPLYSNAVYYCSQDSVTALCARSDDGGLTFGPGVPTYTLLDCGGAIHGHVKVAPDGTVYVPNASCGAHQIVAVSTDNGVTWTVRPIPDSQPGLGLVDPSVGIASDGTVYFGYQDQSGHPKIAVSHDRGVTWSKSYDVGGPFNIQNSTFPEVVAGDPQRAAFMFLGSPTGGNYEDPVNFNGIWHAYIATTYDGGQSYITVDATPTQPVQVGSICDLGTTGCSSNAVGGADRNMLDFMDLTIDSQGRVLGAFAAGCVAGSCDATSPPSASRSALGTIIRQSGGRRLLAAYDPIEPDVPGAPQGISALQYSNGVLVRWNPPDSGGAKITRYRILRGTASGKETLYAQVVGTKNFFLDTKAVPSNPKQYYYKIQAQNSQGISASCGELVEAPAPAPQTSCKLPGITVITDPTGDQTAAPANSQLDIQSISIAEPFTSTATPNQLTFTMKVANLTAPLQPNSAWTIFFTAPNGTEYFVDMNTNAAGGTVAFEYGHVSVSPTGGKLLNSDGAADPSSNYTADGTIQIVIADSLVGALQPTNKLVSIYGNTQLLVGAAGTGLLENADTTVNGSYILVGNQSCQ